ncbi:odorant receptor 13a-like [Anoplophora glabripennis]|uniref:odorant receptor 13a-like n=1 Tax=Anoplophora glabripennis TaxID=217634 RepID=UPI000A12E011|nr:odorant receptor 13a-like [Anoplophora glabripennis]
MYEISKEKSFYSSLTILRYTYAIPSATEKSGLTWFRFIFIVIRLASLLNFVILPCLHLISTVRAKTGVDISEDLSTMFGAFGFITNAVTFLILYEKWSQFFIDVEDCNRFEIPEGIEERKKKLNLYSLLYALYAICGVLIYGVIASSETSYCKRMNEEHGLSETCGMFTPIVLPFDGSNVYIRSIIFGIQMLLGMFTLPSTALISFLLYEGVETLILHITQLKKSFIEVFDVASNAERKKRLRFCVYYHINILSLCQRLSTLGKYTSGFLCMACALVFGCIGNLILKSKPIAGISYLLEYVFALFLLCHGGQRLLDETLSVADVIYDTKWYDGDVQIMRDIRFILARSQIPVMIGALPLGCMNYALFLMIMKTSYSYLTLLTQNT